MAVTGLDFSSPTIQHHNHDPAFIIMDRRSIDLNKHAFDLNEVPLNDSSLEFHGASSSHELGNSLLPKRGGWLELFRNMFGQDKVVMGGFPFASCATTLNSSCSNNISQADEGQHSDLRPHSSQALQADERQHSDFRIHSSQDLGSGHKFHSGNGVDQNHDIAMQSVASASGLASQSQQHKLNRTRKLPIFDEFNHGNIFNTLPIGSHARKAFFNVAGQLGCPNSFPTSVYPTAEGVKLNAGVGQQGCDALGWPQLSDGLQTSFHHSPEQGSVGSSISHGFNHYKAPLPVWDLNSRPIPQWNPDLQPIEFSKAPCTANSRFFSQHSGKYTTESQAQVMENIGNTGPCAQVSDVSRTNFRQENGFSEDCKAFSTCLEKKNGLLCAQMKGGNRSHRGKALESINGDNLPLLSADKGKGQDLRVCIIESAEWLPAGWITEVKTRMTGSTAGTTDKYYKDPVTGRRFRSKNEVLNFLQTGRLCRNKPQIKAVGTVPLLLPRQEQRIGLLDSFQAVAANHTSVSSANDMSSQASVCQRLSPPGVICDRIVVKQEQDDSIRGGLKAGDNGCRLEEGAARGELSTYNLQGLEVPEIERFDLSIRPESSSACIFQEPVHSSKRKLAGDFSYGLPSKRLCGTVKELQDQDKWIFCVSPFLREAEAQAGSSIGVETFDAGIARTLYPGLLYKQETNGTQDEAVTQYLAARYQANAKALGLYERPPISSTSQVNLGFIRLKTGSTSKVVEKKSQKLTLKQERDLFVSLGRKLCLEFLASAKESCLQ